MESQNFNKAIDKKMQPASPLPNKHKDPEDDKEEAILFRTKEIIEDAGLLSGAIGDYCDSPKLQLDRVARWSIYDGLQSNLTLNAFNERMDLLIKAAEALGKFNITAARWKAENELEETS